MSGEKVWCTVVISIPIHPKGAGGVEVRALFRTLDFFHIRSWQTMCLLSLDCAQGHYHDQYDQVQVPKFH